MDSRSELPELSTSVVPSLPFSETDSIYEIIYPDLGRCTGLLKAHVFAMITVLFGLDSMKEHQKIFCFFVFPEEGHINNHSSVSIKKLKAKQGENKEESFHHVTSQISIHNEEVYHFKSYRHARILFKRKNKMGVYVNCWHIAQGTVFIMPATFIIIKGIIRFRCKNRRCFFLPVYYLRFKVVNHKALYELKKLIYFQNVHLLQVANNIQLGKCPELKMLKADEMLKE